MANAETDNNIPTIEIKPPRGWLFIDLKEIWQYRELFGFLVWRDIQIKYKQALLGIGWAIIGPLATTVIFTLIFGKLANMPSDGLPKPIFYMCGLVIWRYFSQAITFSSNCLVQNQALLTKIYVPRVIIPTSSVISNLVDFTVGFGMLILLMAFFKVWPPISSLLIIPLTFMAMLTALGVGLLFSALNVKYRDIRHVVPFVTQLWMYCTVIVPYSEFVLWTKNQGFPQLRYLYGLNPMAGVVEGFRWALAHHVMPPEKVTEPWEILMVGLPVTIALVLAGLFYFKRVEGQFADLV
ncbi:MAG: ABC transporter permease [Candidatus Sumerlaeia bacterium]